MKTSRAMLLSILFLGPSFCLKAEVDLSGKQLLPDPREGNVEGKSALYALPFIRGESREVLPAVGFEAHFVPTDDVEAEYVLPMGKWILPPPRHPYRVWAEGEWQMSPSVTSLLWGEAPFKEKGLTLLLPVGPAGRVALDPASSSNDHLELRLLHAETTLRDELSRRKKATAVGEGLLMPVGKTIAAFWDTAAMRYVGLSRPFDVEERKVKRISMQEPPKEFGQLMVLIHRAKIASATDDPVEITLHTSEGEKAPDFTISNGLRTYGFFYELPTGKLEILARTKQAQLKEVGQVTLAAQTIERYEARLESSEGAESN